MKDLNYAGSQWAKWDLHIHSNASDGNGTPQQIIEKAKEKGLSVIALTDHHTVKNIDEKSYITYESEPEKITSEERAKVQKGAVTINNIQIENKNFDVNILSKLLDKVTCNKDEVLKQLAAK